ncbi:DNA polymerase III subunit alpha, partial [Plesiomonas shigelloides]|nr:DNA polymerase III subunit alpha [Plesiomonas shigelloides]
YLKGLDRDVPSRLKDMVPSPRGQVTVAAGWVVAARVMTTKRGSRIGLMTLDVRSGRLEVMLLSDALDRYQHRVEKDRILLVTEPVSFDDYSDGLRLTAREVHDIGEAREQYARALPISLPDGQNDDQCCSSFRQALEPHPAGTV